MSQFSSSGHISNLSYIVIDLPTFLISGPVSPPRLGSDVDGGEHK